MGEVFLGLDTRLQRKVALKRLTPDPSGGDDLRDRMLREARAAARLTHSHIAGVYDVLEHEGHAIIVMEYVEGESLRARLARGRLSIDEVVAIGRELASALAAAHAHGVIHRDLKPSNVQLTPSGSVKILDFGVAKLEAPVDPATTSPTTTRQPTITGGASPGTPVYMAPEQLLRGQTDARSDIYSLGVILFEMATGRRPYAESDTIALAVAMSTTNAPPADAVDTRVPHELSLVIAHALAREPADRFESAGELESALEAVGDPRTTTSVRPSWRPARRAPSRRAIAVAAIVFALVAVASWPLLRRAWVTRRVPGSTPPAVLAILPVDNPSGDPRAHSLGAEIATVVAGNFGSIPGLTVISGAATVPYEKRRADLTALRHDLGATHVLDLTVNVAAPEPQVRARLRGPDAAAPIWEQTISGDVFAIEATLLEQLGRALVDARVWPRRLTAADWARIRRLPTTSADALGAYSEARALLDRVDAPADSANAVTLLERAVAIDPRFALAYAALGDAYLEQYRAHRDPAQAAKAQDAVMQALRISPDEASSYYSLGNVQWATGRYQDAVSSLRRSLELQPDSDETHRLLARVLADRGDLDGALLEVQHAIRIRPEYWRSYMVLGSISYAAGRFSEALEAYRRASELQPNDPGPWSGLGLIYQVVGDLPQAIGNYEHAVRLGPNATAYSNLGLVYYSAGRYDAAVNAWTQALAINPNSVLYHRNIGDAYQRLRQPQAAASAYRDAVALGEQLLKVNPRDAETIAHVAVCEAKLGREAAARGHAAEALVLSSNGRVALQRSAEVHALLGDTDLALKDLAAAIEHGYARSLARHNDEFESLRKLPAFQALVAPRPAATSQEK